MSKKHHDEHHQGHGSSHGHHPADDIDRSAEQASADKPTDTVPTDDAVARLQRQIDELTEALQRERADAVNLRRRHEEDLAAIKTRLKVTIIRDLLPVVDNLERALKHVPAELADNDYVKGVGGVVKQFEKTLTGIGVERIATADQPFDPRYHEAVAMEDGDGSREIVSEELQAGYRIGDDVVRHAMVKVRLV